MIVKQILLAATLLLVAFVMEVTRRVVTGDQPTTFLYGNFLWILLFVSAQPPFLRRSATERTFWLSRPIPEADCKRRANG